MAQATLPPVLISTEVEAGENVDLGLRVPSVSDPAGDDASNRRESVVVCRVCQKAYAKYTCPRCHTRYCALTCYKAHDKRCVESFHGDNLEDAMKGLTVEDEEKKRMSAILKKYAEAHERGRMGETSSSEVSSSESDGENEDTDEENGGFVRPDTQNNNSFPKKYIYTKNNARCVLSSANLEKLQRGEDLRVGDLTFEELENFERAALTGELSHMIDNWVPWWTLPESRDVKLTRDGSSRVVEAIEGDGSTGNPKSKSERNQEERNRSALPDPADHEPLLPLNQLLGPDVKPSPSLKWHVLDALAAYVCVARVNDGDWHGDALAAAHDLVAFSPTLAEGAKPYRAANVDSSGGTTTQSFPAHLSHAMLPSSAAVAMAGVAAAVAAAGATRAVAAAAAAATANGLTHRDVRDILRGGRGAVILALCDARRIVRTAIGELEEAKNEDLSLNKNILRKKEKELTRVERKLFFLACWAADTTPGDGTIKHILSWCERTAQKKADQKQSVAFGEARGATQALSQKIQEL